jgi:Leu/Phe-tRNA-protein transferase
MSEQDSLKRVAELLEYQIALDLYFRGVNQNTIARVLKRSKTWVNDLLQGVPKGDNS